MTRDPTNPFAPLDNPGWLDEIEIPSIARDGSISADWLAMTLAEDARIENGRLANAEYLAVKIASVSDFILARAVKAEAELARLRAIPGLSDVLDGKATIIPSEIGKEDAEGVWEAAYNVWAEFGASDAEAGQAAHDAIIAISPYRNEVAG